tara:strand:+ start:565 stop:747 length:183 start_codon:yes stop_codon:yes gene_type:complete
MLFSTKENRMSDEEDTELDFTDPLRASIYSLAYMLQGTEKDLPEDVLQIIEDIIYQERNH